MIRMPLLRMDHITKRYPGVLALEEVSFELRAGEVHCLVGENGAGKSTLMKILSGAIPRTGGALRIEERPVEIDSPIASQRLGIGMIYQDFKLVPELTVAENITLGSEIRRRRSPFVDAAAMRRAARESLERLGESLDPDARVGSLTVAQMQVVEIAKALSRDVRILALDEPTASLTGREIDNLFRVIGTLRDAGVGVIYISHRLEEIFRIGDRVTILRDGRVVNTAPVGELDRRALIALMVGRELEQEFPRAELRKGEELLRVEHLCSSRIRDVSFSLARGEIVGLAGLVGAGRSELAFTLFGADPKSSGRILLDGREIAPRHPHEAIEEGIALLTEDRNRLGLILPMNVRENITLANLRELRRGPFIRRAAERDAAGAFVRDLAIRPPDMDMPVDQLSGGNRQKVILARWLNTKAKLLLFDEPTAGIDVGARYEIYLMMNDLARRGIGVLVISSDLPELLGICDRIIVMAEGRIAGELPRAAATQENIMHLAVGG